MLEAFGQILPLALVIALSPIPIVAVIAMLFSHRAVASGVAFLVGWVAGVAGGLALLVALASTQDLGSEDAPSAAASLLRLGLGVLLLAGALRYWRKRPAPGEQAQVPGWMARVATIRPMRACGLGVLLAVNPKNLLMNVAAATVLVSADLPVSDTVVVIALYTVVASSTVATAVAYRSIAGDRAVARLEQMRSWLVANNATVMCVLFLVLGGKLVGDALAGL